MILLYLYIGFVGLTFGLWFYYVQVMGMMAARDAGRIPPDTLRICQAVLLVGLAFDVLYNVIIGTIIFLDLPREATLTARLIRYKKAGGWRGKVANYICANLLDPFDPSGCHCKTN
jgi:uncharacterized protein with PQ loop repeat